ncbi:MAG: hypothetical protein AB7O44_31715 [Hyphomicrobiaceae bacterium]
MERDRIELMRARMAMDRHAIAAAEEEIEIKQKVTEELRKANPLLADQYQAQIRSNSAARQELEIRAGNAESVRGTMRSINDTIISGVRESKKFHKIWKKILSDLIESIARIGFLNPLEGAVDRGLAAGLTNIGFNPQTGVFGLAGPGGFLGFFLNPTDCTGDHLRIDR